MKKCILALMFLALMVMPVAFAELDFEQPLTPEEEQQFDAILAPVMKVYNFVTYAATIIGVLVLVFAGVSFITAGGEQGKKDRAKNTAAGVIIGLIIIWVAPLVVKFIFS